MPFVGLVSFSFVHQRAVCCVAVVHGTYIQAEGKTYDLLEMIRLLFVLSSMFCIFVLFLYFVLSSLPLVCRASLCRDERAVRRSSPSSRGRRLVTDPLICGSARCQPAASVSAAVCQMLYMYEQYVMS